MGGLLLLVVLAGVGIVKNKNKKTGTPVTTDKAIVKTITQVVTATGKIQPEVEVKISPEVGGEIIEMPFKEGASVKKGAVLVKIRPDFYKAQTEQAEANLSAAKAGAVQSKAQLIKSQQDFKRSEDLYGKKLISDSEYISAKTSLDVAQANLENSMAMISSSQGQLKQSYDQLNKTTIYSPMDGTISALSSEVGERIIGGGQFAGTEIMRVADLANMEVRVKVNENDIVNVKIGDRAIISIDAYPGQKFSGLVKEISSSAQNTSGATSQAAAVTDDVTNFLVKIRISDRDIQLRPGMSATADIQTQTAENVIAVPIQSVTVRAEGGLTSDELQKKKARESKEKSGADVDTKTERDDARRTREQLDRVVFVINGNKVRLQKVETGIADLTHIEVKAGVKDGDEIVSGSYAAISRRLKDGMEIQIEKPKTPDAK